MADKFRVQSYDNKNAIGEVYTADKIDELVKDNSGTISHPSLSLFLGVQSTDIRGSSCVVPISDPPNITDVDYTFTSANNSITCNFTGRVIIDFTAFVYTNSTSVNHNVNLDIRLNGVSDKQFAYEYDNDETDDFPGSPRTYSWAMEVASGQYIDFMGYADSDSGLDAGSVIRILRVK